MSTLRVDEITNQNDDGPVYFKNGVSGDGTRMTLQPGLLSLSPPQLSTNVAISTSIEIAFTQNMQFLGVGTIYIREGSASGSISTYFTCGVSTEATITSNLLTINPKNDLNTGTRYFVTLPSVGIANTNATYIDEVTNYQFETEYSFFDAQGGDYEQVVVAPASPTGYYKYNVFTTSGIATFSAPSATAVDFAYVLVGGGGGGGDGGIYNSAGGGGGGAGGHIYNYNSNNLPAGNYTVTIGSGGSGTFDNPGGTDAPPTAPPTGNYATLTTSGQNSSFGPSPVGTIIAYGGGAGGRGANRMNPYAYGIRWNNSGTQPTSSYPSPSNPDYTYVNIPPSPTTPLNYPLPANQWGCGGAPGGSGGGHSSAYTPYYFNDLRYTRIQVAAQSGVGYPGPNQQGYPGGAFNINHPTVHAVMGSGGGGAAGAGGAGGSGPSGYGPLSGSGGAGKATPEFPGPGLTVISGFPTTLASTMGPTGRLAGGGGGSIYQGTAPQNPADLTYFASGGSGGGGQGGGRAYPAAIPTTQSRSAARGVENTGSGGGSGPAGGGPGGTYQTPAPGSWYGQNGGSGIMMIRYAHPGA